MQNPKVVFCISPFKGAEVSLRIHIMKLMEKLLEKKIAVVILAVNLADSLGILFFNEIAGSNIAAV
ncbi:MAG: hypothetical protein QM697_08925 [Lachnospiraceae bacterium]